MKIRAFITHKKAECFKDCQDRFCVNLDTKSIAVSDGMGSTWQQKIWADLLVHTFVDNLNWVPNLQSAKELSPIWRKKVLDYIQWLKDTNAKENIIFRNERNLSSGKSAGATFCGVRFDKHNWSCSVLGDSCFLEYNKGNINFYTSQNLEKFDSFPDYFDSDDTKDGSGTLKQFTGKLSKDIILFMVSDPFSDFLLEHQKLGDVENYIHQMLSINSHDDFETLVAKWRDLGMHNDDSTLVILEHDGDDKWNIYHQDNLNELIHQEQNVTQISSFDSKDDKKELLTTQKSKITKEEFCKEFLKLSENIFVFSDLRYLFDTKKNRRKKTEIELMKIAEELYSQYEIQRKK